MWRRDASEVSAATCLFVLALFLVGLVRLAVELKALQVDAAPGFNYAKECQSIRRVQTAGRRGRILDAKGRLLAGNRLSTVLLCEPVAFQRKTWQATAEAMAEGIDMAARLIGRPSPLSLRAIRRHVNRALSMPLEIWHDLTDEELARFTEHAIDLPGFTIAERYERVYPEGDLASHVIGYVGRGRGDANAGDVAFHFFENELHGRAGLEFYYDSFLRGVAGERHLLVDARGFTMNAWDVTQPKSGPDLTLTLDAAIQRDVQRQLTDVCGACVVLDAHDGAVLAMASSPGYDLNAFVPTLGNALYAQLSADTTKPLLNRAAAGSYAPGSTFKPLTAIAALELGIPADTTYTCDGAFELGGMRLHCSRRWGHGRLTLREALRDSCNPFFCNLGCEVGTGTLCRVARAFGLGTKTGIDLPNEVAGVVPDHEWKMRTYGERWYPGDLMQMSIGQGMLLVSPLQMACVAAAIGTGRRVVPHLRVQPSPDTQPLPFSKETLDIVREGMRMVVEKGGTGEKGAEGVNAWVIGKTGTAEIGQGATRRKNTWFLAFAQGATRRVAVAMVIENGVSGGSTTAPRVAQVLKTIFRESHG